MPQIEQSVLFPAIPAAVYRALTNAAEFASFSGVPAQIDATPGGAFHCFGEFILGRFIELVPDQRIVQAWRVFDWPVGVYSICCFALRADGDGTRLLFTQNGVPTDAVAHVDAGWDHKYWQPLRAHLTPGT